MGRNLKDEKKRVGFIMNDKNWTFVKYYMYISGLSLTDTMNKIVKDYRKGIEEENDDATNATE